MYGLQALPMLCAVLLTCMFTQKRLQHKQKRFLHPKVLPTWGMGIIAVLSVSAYENKLG